MTVQTDNGGVPSGDVLASREFQWSDANGSNFPLFRFGSPARLTAGQRYHLVFNNIDSSPASSWMLRAIRRLKSSGRPKAVSNGSVVMMSAPPTAAAKVAIVVRNRFTHGSSRVIIRQLETAC